MTPQAFVESRLRELSAPNVAQPAGDVKGAIFAALQSKKFRKYANTPQQQDGIKRAIQMNMEKREPIKFGLPFGAYKLWRFEEAPEVDWAELFALMYYAKWLKPVAELYGPGVQFEFLSDEAVIERMNNIPKADTAEYARTLKGLFDFLKTYTPRNMMFSLTPTGSFYTPEEFEVDLKERIQELFEQQDGYRKLDQDDIRSIEMNVRLKPGQDEDPLWREKVDLIHHAYYMVKKRRPYYRAPERIAVFPTDLPNYNCIAVGTTKTSIAKFWVGVGALKKADDSFIETILSPTQLERATFEWAPMSIDGLKGKNFEKLRIVRS